MMVSNVVLFAVVAFVCFKLLKRRSINDDFEYEVVDKYTPDNLPQELHKFKPFYDQFGYPSKHCADNSKSMRFSADGTEKIYGSKKAAVVYNPGCLNGANWRVCGLDETGEYETFSMNIFGTREQAEFWASSNGYEFTTYPFEKQFKALSEKPAY